MGQPGACERSMASQRLRSWSKRRMARWYLAKLPEAALFPSVDELGEAVLQFERNTNPLGFIILHATIAAVPITAMRLWLPPVIPLPRFVNSLFWSLMIALAASVYPALRLRRRAAKELRRRLLDLGVPVCIKCGYCLRSLTSDRCPECGKELDVRVRDLIREDAQRDGSAASDGPAP